MKREITARQFIHNIQTLGCNAGMQRKKKPFRKTELLNENTKWKQATWGCVCEKLRVCKLTCVILSTWFSWGLHIYTRGGLESHFTCEIQRTIVDTGSVHHRILGSHLGGQLDGKPFPQMSWLMILNIKGLDAIAQYAF